MRRTMRKGMRLARCVLILEDQIPSRDWKEGIVRRAGPSAAEMK